MTLTSHHLLAQGKKKALFKSVVYVYASTGIMMTKSFTIITTVFDLNYTEYLR
jgi:hypothetical protein